MAKQVTSNKEKVAINQIQLSYNETNSDASALELVYTICPQWKTEPGPVQIVPFKNGLMNTLLKITKLTPGCTELENDKKAILLRAYGNDADGLIDRDMEANTHALLAQRGLAAPLLARFQNGLLYNFVPGRACTPQDLVKEPVWCAVAARLGEWHARMPLPGAKASNPSHHQDIEQAPQTQEAHTPSSNLWTVLYQWVAALRAKGAEEETRNAQLKAELDKCHADLSQLPGCSPSNFVLGHGDLLSANVIIPSSPPLSPVHFIDYEFAVPCPPAFDLANHFSEWAGFDCDYTLLPTRRIRREFIRGYLHSHSQYAGTEEELMAAVDRYRGMPGFYWGVQSLIQADISRAEFDWTKYAQRRLEEYWAWRGEEDGMRSGEIALRERRWAEE